MIDVVLVDDEVGFSQFIIGYLENAEEIRFNGYFRDCEQALSELKDDIPDVILLDIDIPKKMSGIDAIPHFKKKFPETKIVMFTKFDGENYLFEALKNGADGYLLKSSPPEKIIKIIVEMFKGQAPIDMTIAYKLIDYFHKHPPVEPLTDRQTEILKKVAEGKTNKRIADELFISVSTVKFHIHNIYQILHVTNKAQAIAKAIKNKII